MEISGGVPLTVPLESTGFWDVLVPSSRTCTTVMSSDTGPVMETTLPFISNGITLLTFIASVRVAEVHSATLLNLIWWNMVLNSTVHVEDLIVPGGVHLSAYLAPLNVTHNTPHVVPAASVLFDGLWVRSWWVEFSVGNCRNCY